MLQDIEMRNTAQLLADAPSMNMVGTGNEILLVGKSGPEAIQESVLWIQFIPKPARGKLAAFDLAAGFALRRLGLDAVTTERQSQSAWEVSVNEEAQSLPYEILFLVPQLPSRSTFSLKTGLKDTDAAEFDHVDVRFWTPKGTASVHGVSGLVEIVRNVEIQQTAEQERKLEENKRKRDERRQNTHTSKQPRSRIPANR